MKKNTQKKKQSIPVARRKRTASTLPSKYAAKPWKVLLVVFVLLAIAGVMVAWFQTKAAGNAALTLSPGATSIIPGDTFTLQIRALTGQEKVNVIQANLVYPADKLEFVNIDASGSALPNTVQESGRDGTVFIGRYSNTNESAGNDLLVAKVTFKAIADTGTAEIAFRSDSLVVRAQDSTDILGSTTPAAVGFSSSYDTPNVVTAPVPRSVAGASPVPGANPTPSPGTPVDIPLPAGSTDTPTVSGVLRVTSKSANQETAKIELSVSEETVAADDTAPFETMLDTTLLSNGEHTLSLRTIAKDGSAEITFKNIKVANKLGVIEKARNSVLASVPVTGLSGRAINMMLVAVVLFFVGMPVSALYILRRYKPVVF